MVQGNSTAVLQHLARGIQDVGYKVDEDSTFGARWRFDGNSTEMSGPSAANSIKTCTSCPDRRYGYAMYV